MSRISVIGLGAMGAALAHTLLQNGYTVTVWNRNADRTRPLVEDGAVAVASAADAIAASPATITCIATHAATHDLLEEHAAALRGRTIIELSTGGAEEAEKLAAMLQANGAEWLLGIINAYPSMIGDANTVLSIVGDPQVWARWEKAIKTLGGASSHFGTEAGMAAVVFAAPSQAGVRLR